MKKVPVVLVACLCFVSLSFGASPTPKWPTAFNTTMDLFRRSQRQYLVARWFRDESAKMERFDTSGDQGYDIDIRRYDKGMRYTIYHQLNELKCAVTNLTTNMPPIDLSNYKYIRQLPIGNVTCDEFDAPTPNAQFSEYFQNSATGIPVRLETSGPNDEVLDFFKFNEASQGEPVFDASIVAPGVTCTYQPNDDFGFVRMAWLDAPDASNFVYYAPPLMTKSYVTGPLTCESGDASWYSCSGSGACAPCTPSDNTAAHKTLACGTATTVTDTDNGRSVNVKIEDRGPYVTGRIIDMNHAPAVALDMISAGVVPARVCY